MILYHGSNVKVENPILIPSKRFLDFGPGFYLTSDLGQAQKWAKRTSQVREEGSPVVNVFTIEDDKLKSLQLLSFESANKEWLRFITANRTGKHVDDGYDVIVGPVANDQAIRTVNNYIKGYFSEDIAIQLLLPQKLKDQYVFKTEKALQYLNFVKVEQI